MDVKECLYERLVGMFEKWKVRVSPPEKKNVTGGVQIHTTWECKHFLIMLCFFTD